MKVELRNLEFPGSLERERIVLRATEEINIARYAVFSCEVGPKGSLLGGDVEHAFWFGSQLMKAGDLAVLYTKDGVQSEKKNGDGTTSYFFYWEKNRAIWATGKLIPVLVSTPSWKYLGEDTATQEPDKKEASSG